MSSEILPQSQAPNPIDRIVDHQERRDARQAEVHDLVRAHEQANGVIPSFTAQEQAIAQRRTAAHAEIEQRYSQRPSLVRRLIDKTIK